MQYFHLLLLSDAAVINTYCFFICLSLLGMFPGDVQRVRAVPSIPSSPYVFMENVLIFSSKGDRPLQDMLGGGDLDGDEVSINDHF